MKSTSYNSEKADVPSAEKSPKAGFRSSDSPRSQLLSRKGLHDNHRTCDHSKVSDDDLVTAAQCGDQQAFAELCGRHSSWTKNLILKIVRNHEDAEDALQDALLRAYTHLNCFRRSCKFSTWLRAIGVNSALMIMRKRKSRGETVAITSGHNPATLELEPIERSLGPEGICLQEEIVLLVRREIEKLSPSLRSAITHYHRSECSLEEAAKMLDISVSATKSRLSRGRVKLRSLLACHQISKSRN